MAKRMIWMLIAVTAVLTVLGFFKYHQVTVAIAEASSFRPPPEAVTTVVAERRPWRADLAAVGSVTAVRGVTVSADLPGVVERIAFESGRRVSRGDLLVQLDTRQEQAQLAAARAQRDLARLGVGRLGGLRAKGVVSQAELDRSTAELEEAEGRVREIQATIDRKTIRAPFSGILGIRQVNLGQYLSGGDPVVPLQALDPIFVDFAVPQQEIGRLGVGTEVRVSAEGMDLGMVSGRVTAVDSVADEATRNVRIQATLENREVKLRPGMFVEVHAAVGGGTPLVALPASAISYASFGDSVYIVEDLRGPDGESYRGVRQQFVKLGGARGDQVAVVSGVEAGQEVVSSGVFKLRNGAAVLVNNSVQPGNDPAPDPENS